jgi:sugar phosphate isomerase/epimerase
MRLSLQLYTLRDQLASDETGTLAKVADVGYKFVETGGRGAGTQAYKDLLDRSGLAVSGIHTGIDQLENDLPLSIEEAKILNSPYIIVPWLDESRRKNWAELGKKLNTIGEKIREAGLTLAYHNHDFEFRQGGFEDLYNNSDPENVKAELDVAWVQIGGADPIDWINRLSKRLPLVHLKDFDSAKDPVWQIAGEGLVDWDGVLDACERAGVQYGAVELDAFASDPLDAIKGSYDFFTARGIS